jgi:hypothetical protein
MIQRADRTVGSKNEDFRTRLESSSPRAPFQAEDVARMHIARVAEHRLPRVPSELRLPQAEQTKPSRPGAKYPYGDIFDQCPVITQ